MAKEHRGPREPCSSTAASRRLTPDVSWLAVPLAVPASGGSRTACGSTARRGRGGRGEPVSARNASMVRPRGGAGRTKRYLRSFRYGRRNESLQWDGRERQSRRLATSPRLVGGRSVTEDARRLPYKYCAWAQVDARRSNLRRTP